jgi:hypothetical protein
MNIIKLRSLVADTTTRLVGMVTHYQVEMNGNAYYRFQPKGLNPETGTPVDGLWLVENRLDGGKRVDVELPMQVLGTEVEDLASGFKGTAIALVLHTTGCVHVQVQPKGTLPKTGAPIAAQDFDIRRLKGNAIPVLTEEEEDADIKRRPSPSPVTAYRPACR